VQELAPRKRLVGDRIVRRGRREELVNRAHSVRISIASRNRLRTAGQPYVSRT